MGRTMIYKSYVFRTKDPSIDGLRTLVQDHFGGRLTRKTLKAIADKGGPQVATMCGWFFGEVRRPHNAGLEAAGRALGYERRWVRANSRNGRG